MMDGLERNLHKFSVEWAKSRAAMSIHWKRWRSAPWDTHAYVNLFVEARRASPYLWGHVDAVLYPLLIAALVGALVA